MNKPITDTSKHKHSWQFARLEDGQRWGGIVSAYYSYWVCTCGAVDQRRGELAQPTEKDS